MATARRDRKHGLAIKSVRDPASPDDGQRNHPPPLASRDHQRKHGSPNGARTSLRPRAPPVVWARPRAMERVPPTLSPRLVERSRQLGALRALRDRAKEEKITLVYDAHDHEHNEAVALLDIADKLR